MLRILLALFQIALIFGFLIVYSFYSDGSKLRDAEFSYSHHFSYNDSCFNVKEKKEFLTFFDLISITDHCFKIGEYKMASESFFLSQLYFAFDEKFLNRNNFKYKIPDLTYYNLSLFEKYNPILNNDIDYENIEFSYKSFGYYYNNILNFNDITFVCETLASIPPPTSYLYEVNIKKSHYVENFDAKKGWDEIISPYVKKCKNN